jgi:DNA repair photolyase
MLGGLSEHLRFFHLVDPSIRRKTDIEGQAIKSAVDLEVARIESLNETRPLYDITTGTGDFIANGVVSHNCYARPTHEYWGLSAGLDFETTIFVKDEAPRLLSERFQTESWTPQPVALSGNTDPYQPVERELGITRSCLAVFQRHRNPVSIVTKSGLIRRDVDLLAEMAERHLVTVAVSLTTVDDGLAGKLEPRAARPSLRLRVIEELTDAGVPVSILVAPLIPGLNDEEIPAILEAAADRGARTASYVLLRLPGPVEPIFVDWVEAHFPERKTRILGRLRDLRDGRLNDPEFGRRMRGEGEWARVFRQLFRSARATAGLDGGRPPLSTDHFRRLPGGQPSLFDE